MVSNRKDELNKIHTKELLIFKKSFLTVDVSVGNFNDVLSNPIFKDYFAVSQNSINNKIMGNLI